VNTQDSFAALPIGKSDNHLTIESSGPKQRRIKDVRSVRGCEHDHFVARIETVHLH
jgi:hypothetical protein